MRCWLVRKVALCGARFAQVRAARVANNIIGRINVELLNVRAMCLICFYLAQAGGWVGSTEAQGFVWK